MQLARSATFKPFPLSQDQLAGPDAAGTHLHALLRRFERLVPRLSLGVFLYVEQEACRALGQAVGANRDAALQLLPWFAPYFRGRPRPPGGRPPPPAGRSPSG